MERDERDDERDEPVMCPHCSGSGEGMADGARCIVCWGSGVVRGEPDEPDPDAKYDDVL